MHVVKGSDLIVLPLEKPDDTRYDLILGRGVKHIIGIEILNVDLSLIYD